MYLQVYGKRLSTRYEYLWVFPRESDYDNGERKLFK